MNFAELTQFKTLLSNEPLITDFESMAMENRKAICKHVKTESYWNMCHPSWQSLQSPQIRFPNMNSLE